MTKFIKYSLLSCMLLLATPMIAQPAGFDPISKAINNRDGGQLSLQMSDVVTITIADKSNIYSRAQSILVIKDFLERQKITQFKISQSGSRDQSLYGIGTMKSKDKTFDVYLYLEYNQSADKYLIKEMKIEG